MAHQLTLNSTSLDELKAKVAALPEEKKIQESKAVTPTKSAQSVTPDSGYDGIAQVDVGAIPDEYADVSGVTAHPRYVAEGYNFVDSNGELQAGGMYIDEIALYDTDATAMGVKVPATLLSHSSNSEHVSSLFIKMEPSVFGTAGSDKVLSGYTFSAGNTVKRNGIMPNNGAAALSINPLSSESVTIPKGYHNGSGTASISGELLTELNEINGAETAATTVADGVEGVATNVDTQAGLIEQIKTALEGKMGGSGGSGSGNMANVQFIDMGGIKSISYSDSDGVKYIDANFPSEFNCSIPSILVIEAIAGGMLPTVSGDITALQLVSYDDDSSQSRNILNTFIVNGNCSITVYGGSGGS